MTITTTAAASATTPVLEIKINLQIYKWTYMDINMSLSFSFKERYLAENNSWDMIGAITMKHLQTLHDVWNLIITDHNPSKTSESVKTKSKAEICVTHCFNNGTLASTSMQPHPP